KQRTCEHPERHDDTLDCSADLLGGAVGAAERGQLPRGTDRIRRRGRAGLSGTLGAWNIGQLSRCACGPGGLVVICHQRALPAPATPVFWLASLRKQRVPVPTFLGMAVVFAGILLTTARRAPRQEAAALPDPAAP